MSQAFKVYCKNVSKDMIPKIMKRMNEFDMVVRVHPDFEFDSEKDSGFLPFKFHFPNPPSEILKNKELQSGFELYIDQFDLEAEKKRLQPKLRFFDKLSGKKQPEVPYATPEIEAKLKECKIVVSFVWHARDSFALRFASLTSAILTEITNGVCSYEDETWYNNQNIVKNAFKEVIEYEQSLSEKDLDFFEFDEW